MLHNFLQTWLRPCGIDAKKIFNFGWLITVCIAKRGIKHCLTLYPSHIEVFMQNTFLAYYLHVQKQILEIWNLKKKHVNFKFNWNTTFFFYFLTSPLLGSSMTVAKIDSWLQGMLTLEPSGKRYFERTSALSEVSEMKAPNDYTICFARIS